MMEKRNILPPRAVKLSSEEFTEKVASSRESVKSTTNPGSK